MKLYEPVAIASLFLMSVIPVNYTNMDNYSKNRTNDKEHIVKRLMDTQKRDYTFIVSLGEFNLTEGVGIKVVHGQDTLNTQTNHIGMATFKAYVGDTVIVSPTAASGKFKNLEKVLTDKNYNIVNVEPIVNNYSNLK